MERFTGKYLSLTSFKRDGRGVATPVWFASDNGHLLVETDAESYTRSSAFAATLTSASHSVTPVGTSTAIPSKRTRGSSPTASANRSNSASLGSTASIVTRSSRSTAWSCDSEVTTRADMSRR